MTWIVKRDDHLQHSDYICHYGVKGMKWGVRKDEYDRSNPESNFNYFKDTYQKQLMKNISDWEDTNGKLRKMIGMELYRQYTSLGIVKYASQEDYMDRNPTDEYLEWRKYTVPTTKFQNKILNELNKNKEYKQNIKKLQQLENKNEKLFQKLQKEFKDSKFEGEFTGWRDVTQKYSGDALDFINDYDLRKTPEHYRIDLYRYSPVAIIYE